jgi:hypothetical protein
MEDTGQAAAAMADMADTHGAILVTQPRTAATVAGTVTVADTVVATDVVGEECSWDSGAEATTVVDGTSSFLSGGAAMPSA